MATVTMRGVVLGLLLPFLAALVLDASLVALRAGVRDYSGRYGRWAVVVGASEGLGEEAVVDAARRGLDVVAVARRRDRLAKVAARVAREFPGREVRTVVADVSDVKATQALVRQVLTETNNDVGLLFYVASLSTPGRFLDQDVDTLHAIVRVNVDSFLVAVHGFAQEMVKRKRGAILFLSSMAGEMGAARVATYAGTKAFQTHFAEALSYELKQSDVDVLCMVVGPTRTETYERVMSASFRDAHKVLEQSPAAVIREAYDRLGLVHTYGRAFALWTPPVVATGWLNKFLRVVMDTLPYAVTQPLVNGESDTMYT